MLDMSADSSIKVPDNPPTSVSDESPSKLSSSYNKCDLLIKSSTSNKCHEIDSNHSPNLVCDSNNHCSSQESVSLASLRRSSKKRVVDRLSRECRSRLLSLPYLLGKSKLPFDKKSNPLENYSRRPLLKLRQSYSPPPSLPSCNDSGLYVDCSGINDVDFFSSPLSDVANGNRTESRQSIPLNSAKMKGLQELLAADKLNIQAIQLQLTAQSQTDTDSLHARPKRSRRE